MTHLAIEAQPTLVAEEKLKAKVDKLLQFKEPYFPDDPDLIDAVSDYKVTIRNALSEYEASLTALLNRYSELKQREQYVRTKSLLEDSKIKHPPAFYQTTMYDVLQPGLRSETQRAVTYVFGSKVPLRGVATKVKWEVVKKNRGVVTIDVWVGDVKRTIECSYQRTSSGYQQHASDMKYHLGLTAVEGGGIKLFKHNESLEVDFQLERRFDDGFIGGSGNEFIQFTSKIGEK